MLMRDGYIRKFMVDLPAILTVQTPDDQMDRCPVIPDHLTSAAAAYLKASVTTRTGGPLTAPYIKVFSKPGLLSSS